MRAVSRALALGLPAGLVGCSLLYGVDGLSDGSHPEADGAPGDGFGEDAVNQDARSLDSATLPDADAVALLDGSSACATPHTFCDDFDDGGLGARWDLQRNVQGSLGLDTTVFVSPSRSLRVVADPSDASGPAYDVVLRKNFSGAFSGIHCEFDVMTDSATPPQTGSGFGINVSGSGTNYFMVWNVDQARLYEEHDPANTFHPITLPKAGQWTRIAVDLAVGTDAGPGQLTLWYDGKQVASFPSLGQPSDISGVSFDLGLALGYAPLNNAWHINYDNAWCDLR
jgi:hypothetical protein